MQKPQKSLSPPQSQELFSVLKARFEKHFPRHPDLKRELIQAPLEANPEEMWPLYQMEQSGVSRM